MRIAVLLALLSAASAVAEEVCKTRIEDPVPAPGETITLAMPKEFGGVLDKNYSNDIYSGQCAGITSVNYLFATGAVVCGRRGLDRDPVAAKRAIVEAWRLAIGAKADEAARQQIIVGYDDCEQFFKTMKETWNDKDNPLRAAIEILQFATNEEAVFAPPRRIIAIEDLMERPLPTGPVDELRKIRRYLANGVPMPLSIWRPGRSHQVLAVGLREKRGDPPKILVIDPNHPCELREIHYPEREGATQWNYPAWKLEPNVGKQRYDEYVAELEKTVAKNKAMKGSVFIEGLDGRKKEFSVEQLGSIAQRILAEKKAAGPAIYADGLIQLRVGTAPLGNARPVRPRFLPEPMSSLVPRGAELCLARAGLRGRAPFQDVPSHDELIDLGRPAADGKEPGVTQ